MSQPAALPDPGSASVVLLDGPAGRIEARVSVPQSDAVGLAVVCHPHPLHGGTMDNKVVYSLARSFEKLGFLTARFNFRGIGASDGEFDDAVGEQDDARAVIEWLREQAPGLDVSLAGFSFGAYVAWQVANGLSCRQLVTVAPPVRYFDSDPVAPQCPWLVVQGGADEVVAAGDVESTVMALEPAPQFELIEGVDHFFHGRLSDLRAAVDAFLTENLGR